MLPKLVAHLRQHILAALALVCSLLSLGGASYAAFSLPAGSVGTRELKNRAITAAKLDPTSVAASIRAWANLSWAGGWRVQASSSDIRVATASFGEVRELEAYALCKQLHGVCNPAAKLRTRWAGWDRDIRRVCLDVLRSAYGPTSDRWDLL